MINNKMKPWYIWLSIFALATLCSDTSRRIKFSGASIGDNFALSNKASVHSLKLIVLYIILPIVLYGSMANILISRFPGYPLLPEIVVTILLLLIYLMGVYATYKHIHWREANIPHLLNRPASSSDADKTE